MQLISSNKYNLDGTYTSMMIDSSNPQSGTAIWASLTYDDINYGNGYYQPCSTGEIILYSSYTSNIIVATPSCGTSDLKIKWCFSNDNITYTGFNSPRWLLTETDIIMINYQYVKIQFWFYSPLWSDADTINFSSKENTYNILYNGQLIDANIINHNFEIAFRENRLPRGGGYLYPTNSIYDLGSDIYKFNNIYANNINVTTISCDNLNIEYPLYDNFLSLGTVRVEIIPITNLNNYNVYIYNQNGELYINDSGASMYRGYIYLYSNTSSVVLGSVSSLSFSFFSLINIYNFNQIVYINSSYFINNIESKNEYGYYNLTTITSLIFILNTSTSSNIIIRQEN